jgi:hypothetical protein
MWVVVPAAMLHGFMSMVGLAVSVVGIAIGGSGSPDGGRRLSWVNTRVQPALVYLVVIAAWATLTWRLFRQVGITDRRWFGAGVAAQFTVIAALVALVALVDKRGPLFNPWLMLLMFSVVTPGLCLIPVTARRLK